MHNPDPHALSAVITQLPRTVTYTHALERVQRALGTEPYRSPSAGAIYQALIAHSTRLPEGVNMFARLPGHEKRKQRVKELRPCKTCGRLFSWTRGTGEKVAYCSVVCYETRK